MSNLFPTPKLFSKIQRNLKIDRIGASDKFLHKNTEIFLNQYHNLLVGIVHSGCFNNDSFALSNKYPVFASALENLKV